MNFRIIITMLIICFASNSYTQTEDKQDHDAYLAKAISALKNNEYETARDYCEKATELKPDFGTAYILLGSIYIKSRDGCSNDLFLRDIIFCLAVDQFIKAKSVDSTLTDQVDKLIDTYSTYFPSKEDFFDGPKEGERIKVGCWINRETIFRLRD